MERARQMTPECHLDTPLYNSRITNTYLKLVRRRYPRVDVAELLRHAGMEAHQVEDEGHWFTQHSFTRTSMRETSRLRMSS